MLKDRGYRVFPAARHPDDVQRLIDEGFEAIQLDLTDSESIQAAAKEVLARTNRQIYGLFNNGAYGQPGAVEDLSREAIRQQFETNVFGWLELTNALIPAMRANNEGRIVQNSSILGLVAMPYRGAYNASKFAIEGLTDTLRLELRDTNICCSLIEPGPILSSFRANALNAFKQHINVENSPHRDRYAAMLGRLNTQGAAVPFTLPPEAVVKKLIHALESSRPKSRYYVTFPTYLFGYLRRVLPTKALDYMLSRAGGDGKR